MATAEFDDADQKRKRSPAYPSVGLRVALEYAKAIYKHERRSAAPVAVVAGHCNADIKSSKGLRIIAALKQYGLVVESGGGDNRKVRVSDHLVELELSDNENRKKEIIKECALKPTIHKKIWTHYDGELPSDATLKLYLIQDLDFNDAYASRFIKQFRSTLAFAGITDDDIIGDSEVENNEDANKKEYRAVLSPKKQLAAEIRDFPIPLISGGIAVVKVPVPMSQVDFDQLTNTLKAWQPALVREPPIAPDPHDDEGT